RAVADRHRAQPGPGLHLSRLLGRGEPQDGLQDPLPPSRGVWAGRLASAFPRRLRTSAGTCPHPSTRHPPGPSSAELVVHRESARRQAARLSALAEPWLQIGLGAGALADLPGQAILQPEHLHVREAAILVFLQDDAAATRHFRHLAEAEDDELAVV